MRALNWSEDALNDFSEAIAYIAQEDPIAAAAVRDSIDKAVRLLQVSPIGRPGRVSGTYEKLVRRMPYLVAYALSDEAVTILRVIHTRRDWRPEEWPE